MNYQFVMLSKKKKSQMEQKVRETIENDARSFNALLKQPPFEHQVYSNLEPLLRHTLSFRWKLHHVELCMKSVALVGLSLQALQLHGCFPANWYLPADIQKVLEPGSLSLPS